MEPIEPAYGASTLLLIAAAAVALLLFLIIKVRLHAFISLVLVSLVTAVAAGIPTLRTWTVMETTLGLTAFGAALLVWTVV